MQCHAFQDKQQHELLLKQARAAELDLQQQLKKLQHEIDLLRSAHENAQPLLAPSDVSSNQGGGGGGGGIEAGGRRRTSMEPPCPTPLAQSVSFQYPTDVEESPRSSPNNSVVMQRMKGEGDEGRKGEDDEEGVVEWGEAAQQVRAWLYKRAEDADERGLAAARIPGNFCSIACGFG